MSGSVFGSGGGEQAAKRLGVPFLGRVALDPAICESGNHGVPVVIAGEGTKSERAFRSIAGTLAAQVSVLQYAQDQEA